MERGRNISNNNMHYIFKFIDEFKPHNEIETRDKIILEYAYKQNMSALSIAKLNDKRLVSLGRRSKGEPLKGESIARIIKSYNLEKEKRIDYSKRGNYKRRKEITKKIHKNEYLQPKQCAICGIKTKLRLHHIIPIHSGGTDENENLIYVCERCHKKIHILWNKYEEGTNSRK